MAHLKLHFSLFVLIVFLAGCSAETAEIPPELVRPVKLLTVTDLNAGQVRVFPAKVEATRQVELAFKITGHLIEFPILEGDHVAEGEVLARLDSRDQYNNLLNREAEHTLAVADYQRKVGLLERGHISQSDVDIARATLKSSEANLAIARDQLSYTELTAPFDGTVARIDVEKFQMVEANHPVLVFQKDSELDVVIQVPESLVAEVTRQQPQPAPAFVRFSGQPDVRYPVRLKEHATQVSEGTQSYEVVYTLPAPGDMTVLPGMSAELAVGIGNPGIDTPVPVLPVSAVARRDEDGQPVVWVYQPEDGRVYPRTVELGRVTSHGIEVISGISAGDQIVVAGVQHLTEALPVKPLHWQRGV